MSESSRRPAPWITAAILGVVAAMLAVALLVVIPSAKRHDRDAAAPGALTGSEQQAVTAAATEAVNILTFSRKTFTADFNRALAGTTGALKTDLQSKKATTLSTMTTGKFDLKASVAQSAYESSTAHTVLVLVTVNGYNTNDSGVSTLPSPQRLEITMDDVGSKWLASDIESVGIDG